ncbi:hypothetical protein [Burkholderia sp. JKS000303]|uniref:hypothetical protein n=1 Tax=Burkholderia sp. JKS000303 TaxID=1938747 RepID=UPI00211D9054|nr:hypothetical protein [Burkholderia sp. JKS000303]
MSFIAGAAMAGIAPGLVALIVVLSVLAHVEIFAPSDALHDCRLTAHESLQNAAVRAVAPDVDTPALLTNAGTLASTALGCAIAASIPAVLPALERLPGIHFLTPSVSFLGAQPSTLAAADMSAIAVAAFLMSCVATLYPN